MRVLVACECSGRVRDAFCKLGHDAWSCDIQNCEGVYWWKHHQCDVGEVLGLGWDLMIAHPPCTHLAVTGSRVFEYKKYFGLQDSAIRFVQMLMDAPIERIAIENPISVISTKIRQPDQIIQPWMFGNPEFKKTCLWLKNLPELVPTEIIPKGERIRSKGFRGWFDKGSGKARQKNRSVTFDGIANAMADQWGKL